jgi:hypothetical protein
MPLSLARRTPRLTSWRAQKDGIAQGLFWAEAADRPFPNDWNTTVALNDFNYFLQTSDGTVLKKQI